MREMTKTEWVDDIPAKRYFTIGEVSELCGLKAHVLRYWEQEFPQLSPVKRRGNRRYYQRDDVLMIRVIRHLLYEEGFTINGARQKLEQKERSGRTRKSTEMGVESTSTSEPRNLPPAYPQPPAEDPVYAPESAKGPPPEVLKTCRQMLEEAAELLK